MILKVEALVRRIADFELRADFRVESHERVALRGRSGGGKTTLLRSLAGLDPLQGGRIWLGDGDLTTLPPERRGAGYVFQDFALFPTMNVLENVAFGLEMKGVSRADRESQARLVLASVGLAERGRSSVDVLSGGEKSRVALARAFASRPDFILLDEPFAALDAGTRDQVRVLVLQLHAARPIPLIFVSHDAQDIAQVATRTMELRETGSAGPSVGAMSIRTVG